MPVGKVIEFNMNSTNHERQTLTSIQPRAGTFEFVSFLAFLTWGIIGVHIHPSFGAAQELASWLCYFLDNLLMMQVSRSFTPSRYIKLCGPRLQTVVSSPIQPDGPPRSLRRTTDRLEAQPSCPLSLSLLRARSLALSPSLSLSLALALPLSRSLSVSLPLSP